MKQTLLAALLCCFLSSFAAAQTGTVKGTALDSATTKPLSYVTVLVQEQGKTEALKTTFTQPDGSFELAGLPLAGQYQLLLTYVGFQTKTIKLPAFTADKPLIALGKITLAGTTNKLQEVQVTTEKLLVTQDIDKISYNVEADPESKTMTALDMLRKVPLLTVDAEDNIKLNGSGSYKVLVNGKTSSLFVNSPKDVFKSMPASSIKSVEVITNPPSKYEAEGVGGIINIITHKNENNGYNGSVNLGLGLPKSSYGSGFFTAVQGKFGFSGYGGMGNNNSPSNRSTLYRQDPSGTIMDQEGSGKNSGRHVYFSGELSFELDTLNLFTANFSTNRSNGDNSMQQLVRNISPEGQLLNAYSRQNTGTNYWENQDFGVNLQHTFKRNKEQLLTLSYRYGKNGNGNFSDFIYNQDIGTTDNNGDAVEQTLQADYVHPFGKHNLEVGAKSIFRKNTSDYYYKQYDPEQHLYILNPGLSNNFAYDQDINAAYTAVSLKKDKWGLKVGARLEATSVDADFKSSGTVAKNEYTNLIPNVSLSRMLKGMSTLRLSYTQRIERPSLYYLNPYVSPIDPKNISYGNPNLNAATSNVFNLAYNTFVKGTSVNASVFHNFTNNSIQRVTTFNPADSVASTTYGNIGRNSTTGLSLNGNTTFFKKLNVNLNGGISYVDLHSSLYSNSGFSANVFSYISYKFEKNWRVSTNIGYYSPNVLLQGTSAAYMFNSFSVNKQFLKEEKAGISLSVSNPFQENRRWVNEVASEGFYQKQVSYFQARRFSLSFNYRFGKLKGGIKKNKRGIKNDDLQGGGDQKEGGN
ncbi:TonB-dependent receptor domain-containing protein [Pontibacter liquoris]|uniref:TonB-dependent receptor domain-containing protein n=1 Tax=Pontibacter liquoris TaxID=2905677 RepID=UPI001FA7ED17|nr:TonB-dependent receptor [Pontibacter liquoris]